MRKYVSLFSIVVLISSIISYSPIQYVNANDNNTNETTNQLVEPEIIDINFETPTNNLIIENLENANVEILDSTTINNSYTYIKSAEYDSFIANGDYENAEKFIYNNLQSDCDNNNIDALTMQFEGSLNEDNEIFQGNPAQYYQNFDYDSTKKSDYNWNYNQKDYVGWKTEDLNIETTTMTVTLDYTNVGFYKGEKINAVAYIKLTPSKNRNPNNIWDNTQDTPQGYSGTYNPILQVSKSLSMGWVWQNVKEFHVDLKFYPSDEKNKAVSERNYIVIGSDTQNYSDLTTNSDETADYYIINSLKPENNSNELYTRYWGPEYVFPTHEISNAYIVKEYTKNNQSFTSNITTSYTVTDNDGTKTTQFGYNGGANEWAHYNKNADGWAQNSILIIPKATDTLGLTFGNMSRPNLTENAVRSTNVMWSAFSTQSFTQTQEVSEYEDISPSRLDTASKYVEAFSTISNNEFLEKYSDDIEMYDNIILSKNFIGKKETLYNVNHIELYIWLEVGHTEYDKDIGKDKYVFDKKIFVTNLRIDPLKEPSKKDYLLTNLEIPKLSELASSTDFNDKILKYSITEELLNITIENEEKTRLAEQYYDVEYKSNGDNIETNDLIFELTNREKENFDPQINNRTITIQKYIVLDDGIESTCPGIKFTLQLCDENGNPTGVIQEEITNDDGIIILKNLPKGVYLVTELEAPKGYILAKPIMLNLMENTALPIEKIHNYKGPVLPKSGYDGLAPIEAGSILIISSVLAYIISRKQKTNF